MAKICAININAEGTSKAFIPVLERDFAEAKRDGTEVNIVSVEPGLEKALDVNSAYFSLLNKTSIVHKALQVSREGYDALMVLCFLDPGIQETQELVDIPVIGVCEASLLLACNLGRKFAIVTLDEPQMMIEIERNLRHYGLESRTTRNPIVPIDIPSKEWLTKGMANPQWVAEEIKEKAQRCVSEGAEVVVIGCVGLAPIASQAGLKKLEGSDVPIIDCLQAALKMAELRAELTGRLGWPAVSRAGTFAKPRDKDLLRVRKTFGATS